MVEVLEAKGTKGPTWAGDYPKHAHARLMENVKELFWCDARDEQGHLQHASDCEQRDCFVVQGKQQEKITGAKVKMPDHYRCTITLHSAVSGSTMRTSATISNAYRRSLRGKDPGKSSGKGWRQGQRQRLRQGQVERTWVKVVKTRVKADEEEALIARTTTRTRTRTEVTQP